jgi:hypothetical protein
MIDQCIITPGCARGRHEASAHPCGGPWIKVGDPCQFCGAPLAGDEQGRPVPCPKCWISLEGLPLADIKALLAQADLSVG